MLRARRRARRIDVLARDAALVRAFYEDSDTEVDIVVSRGTVSQRSALSDGSVDAAFGRTCSAASTGSPGAGACRWKNCRA
jgi:hypothetical protein